MKQKQITKMENPLPNQISNYPVDGEVRYLFTKTLNQEDLMGLTLIGDSKNFFRTLPKSLLNTIAINGLEVEVYTPNCKNWVKMRYERENKCFKLDKIDWLDVVVRSEFKVGDNIHFWSLYHAEVGPQGILSFLVQKASNESASA